MSDVHRACEGGDIYVISRYLRSGWNWLDLASVLVAYVPAKYNFGFFRTFRVFRALKPLRLVKRNEGMRLVVNTLFNSLPQVLRPRRNEHPNPGSHASRCPSAIWWPNGMSSQVADTATITNMP